MDKLKIARGVTTLVVNSSVHSTISNTLRTFQAPTTKWQTIKAVVGPFVVAAMVADAAEVYAGRKFDEIVKDFPTKESKDFLKKFKENQDKPKTEADEIIVEDSAPTE